MTQFDVLDRLGLADTLELVGLVVGVFLVLVGLGTLSGLPWDTASSLVTAVIEIFGAIVAIAIGIGLAWLVRTE